MRVIWRDAVVAGRQYLRGPDYHSVLCSRFTGTLLRTLHAGLRLERLGCPILPSRWKGSLTILSPTPLL